MVGGGGCLVESWLIVWSEELHNGIGWRRKSNGKRLYCGFKALPGDVFKVESLELIVYSSWEVESGK